MLGWWLLAGMLAAEPATVTEASLMPGPPSRALRAGYAAMHAGRLDAAARAFAGVHEPYHLAHAGEVARRRGDAAEAERLWAAARAGFVARGAKVRVLPIEAWQTHEVAWCGEELAELQRPGMDFGRVDAARLRMRSMKAATRSVLFPFSFTVACTGDREGALISDSGIREYDLTTGILRRSWPLVQGSASVRSFGSGDRQRLLSVGRAVEIWEPGQREPVRYAEEGAPEKVAAMSADGRRVAWGREDGAVIVHDRDSEVTRVLEFAGPEGAREVLALGFDRRGRLVVVHARGDIAQWDVRSGRRLQQHTVECAGCERLEVAAVSNDGASVAVGGDRELRVWSVESGRTLRSTVWTRWDATAGLMTALFGQDFRSIALSDAGKVAVVDDGGAAIIWPPRGPVVQVEPPPPHVSNARLLAEGRVLRFSRGDVDQLVDLTSGARRVSTRGMAWSRGLRMVEWTRGELVVWAAGDPLLGVGEGQHVPLVRRGLAVGERVLAVEVAERGHVAIELMQEGQPRRSMVILGPDGRELAARRVRGRLMAISDDGRWFATREEVQAGDDGDRVMTWRVWSTSRPGGPVHVHSLRYAADEPIVVNDGLVFARGRSLVAWNAVPLAQTGMTAVRVGSLDGAPAVRTRWFPGRMTELVFSADGAEVVMAGLGGPFTRWRWASDEVRTNERTWGLEIAASADGRQLWLGSLDRVELRHNDDELGRVATLQVLATGGWMVVSESGAVDGSADAVDSAVTVVERDREVLVFGGGLGWGGARVEGLLARALAGEDVAPPGR